MIIFRIVFHYVYFIHSLMFIHNIIIIVSTAVPLLPPLSEITCSVKSIQRWSIVVRVRETHYNMTRKKWKYIRRRRCRLRRSIPFSDSRYFLPRTYTIPIKHKSVSFFLSFVYSITIYLAQWTECFSQISL